jgi:superfamily I DNA and RNA helicase
MNYYIAAAPEKNITIYKGMEEKRSQFRMDYAVTLTQVIRAKGNESDIVYITDFDRIGQRDESVKLRNLIFTALTRTRGLAILTGTGESTVFHEMKKILDSGDRIQFTYYGKPKISRDFQEELKGLYTS